MLAQCLSSITQVERVQAPKHNLSVFKHECSPKIRIFPNPTYWLLIVQTWFWSRCNSMIVGNLEDDSFKTRRFKNDSAALAVLFIR